MPINSQEQTLSSSEKRSIKKAAFYLKFADRIKNEYAADVILHHANKSSTERPLTKQDLTNFSSKSELASEDDRKAVARLKDFFKNKENSGKAISTINFFRQAEKSVDKDFILSTLVKNEKLNEIWNTSYKNFKGSSPLVTIIKSQASPGQIATQSSAQLGIAVPVMVALGGISTATAAAVSGIGLAAQALISAAYNSVNGYKAAMREEKFIKATNEGKPSELQRTVEGGRSKRTLKQVGQSLIAANSQTTTFQRVARVALNVFTLGVTAAASSAAKGRMYSAAANALKPEAPQVQEKPSKTTTPNSGQEPKQYTWTGAYNRGLTSKNIDFTSQGRAA